MSLFKSSNPTLSEKKFRDTVIGPMATQEERMTLQGTLQKFGFMLLMLMGTAFYSWKEVRKRCIALGGGWGHWRTDCGTGVDI